MRLGEAVLRLVRGQVLSQRGPITLCEPRCTDSGGTNVLGYMYEEVQSEGLVA